MSAMGNAKCWLVFDALTAGAIAGLVGEALVLRMNPEVTQGLSGVMIGFPLWTTWGMAGFGLPILAGLLIFNRVRPRADRWPAPTWVAAG